MGQGKQATAGGNERTGNLEDTVKVM